MRLRASAALWYAVAALIPTAFVFAPSLRASPPGPQTWIDWLVLMLPAACAAVSGFLVGVRRQTGKPSGWRSALRGVAVATLAFVLFSLAVGVFTAVDEGDWSYVLLVPPFALLFGGARAGWIILLVGAGAGWAFDRVFTPHREGDSP